MKVIFSKEQSDRILELASNQMIAEVDEAIEPSGYTLRIDVGCAVYGHTADIEISGRLISLGEVQIEF